MADNHSYIDLFSGNIDISIGTAFRLLSSYPASGKAFLQISESFQKAGRKRAGFSQKGTDIPPLMIVSTTEACNLVCEGCYACAKAKEGTEILSTARIDEILDEASELGVSIVMLAGGEPLLSPDWLNALGRHPELLGVLFTNGTLINGESISFFDSHRHIIPTISIEGGEKQTDARRGAGVYAKVIEAMKGLRNARLPFGVSITVTAGNIDDVLNTSFIEEYIGKGSRLFIFVEYVPVTPGSEPQVLSKENKLRLNRFCRENEDKYKSILIAFPGNEDIYGGCLAAGRGFIHVSASGKVEPCPFAPFSDVSLKNIGLKDALASPLLTKIRENHHLLKEGDGGCALWNNKEWLKELQSNP